MPREPLDRSHLRSFAANSPPSPSAHPRSTPRSGCSPGGSLSIIHCQIHQFHFLHNLYLSGKEPKYSYTKSPFISLEIFECIQIGIVTQSIAILDTLRGVLDIRTDPRDLICFTFLRKDGIFRKDVPQIVH